MSAATQTADIHWMIDAQAKLDRYETALRLIAAVARQSKGGGLARARQLARAALAGCRPGDLRAGEFTAALTAEQLADKLRDQR